MIYRSKNYISCVFLTVTLVESSVIDSKPVGSDDKVIRVQDGRGTFDFLYKHVDLTKKLKAYHISKSNFKLS